MIIFLFFVTCAICLFLGAISDVPEGWQDERGFHYGEEGK